MSNIRLIALPVHSHIVIVAIKKTFMTISKPLASISNHVPQ